MFLGNCLITNEICLLISVTAFSEKFYKTGIVKCNMLAYLIMGKLLEHTINRKELR